MKKSKWAGLLLAAVSFLQFSEPQSLFGAGLLIADGGFGGVLEIKEHEVDVTINNGVAVTKVTQIFHNTESRQVEALYTFPVPKGASVANFSMWINGKEMVGEVLEKKRAREIYQSYKVTRQDPGLLEQVDYKTFEMRVFPIGPRADQKVQITYYQELEFDHDWANYIYPLATTTRKDVDSRTTGKFAISLTAKSAVPINAMESPSHGNDFVIAKHDPNLFQASLENKTGSLAKDVVIAYHLSRAQTGLDLITSKRDGEDGYFSLTMTAGDDLAKMNDGMDYVFVIDISGSMAHDGKLLASKDSVDAFISELSEKDRFEVMTFNVQPNVAFRELRTAGEANKRAATEFLATQQARGGTVLNPAMHTAYKYASADRQLNVIILSDGMTEQGERQRLLSLIQERPRSARVFCIGVGNDVNKPLLEQMAQDSGGLAAFISRGDDFSRQAKAFRRKLTRPAASDLQIDFGGIEVYDLQPKQIPNLFHGSPVRVYGRYKGGGDAKVSVRGNINGLEFKQSATLHFPKRDESNPEIDRMWAWRKVDALLKEADRGGNRNGVVDEVVRLGEGYSIVTEYTSFLVLENDAEYKRWKINRVNLLRNERDRNAQVARQKGLDEIRNKAFADLGPQEVKPQQTIAQNVPTHTPSVQQNSPQTPPQQIASTPSRQSHSFNFGGGGGGGPVGPLLIPLLWWMRRARKQEEVKH